MRWRGAKLPGARCARQGPSWKTAAFYGQAAFGVGAWSSRQAAAGQVDDDEFIIDLGEVI
jgi:hypothetical protein